MVCVDSPLRLVVGPPADPALAASAEVRYCAETVPEQLPVTLVICVTVVSAAWMISKTAAAWSQARAAAAQPPAEVFSRVAAVEQLVREVRDECQSLVASQASFLAEATGAHEQLVRSAKRQETAAKKLAVAEDAAASLASSEGNGALPTSRRLTKSERRRRIATGRT